MAPYLVTPVSQWHRWHGLGFPCRQGGRRALPTGLHTLAYLGVHLLCACFCECHVSCTKRECVGEGESLTSRVGEGGLTTWPHADKAAQTLACLGVHLLCACFCVCRVSCTDRECVGKGGLATSLALTFGTVWHAAHMVMRCWCAPL